MTKLCRLLCASIATVAFAQQWPDGPGKETTLQLCSQCHKPEMIQDHRQSRDDWKASIQKMISAGAEGTPDQFAAVLEYVSKNFAATSGASTTAQSAPDTNGPPAGRGG